MDRSARALIRVVKNFRTRGVGKHRRQKILQSKDPGNKKTLVMIGSGS